MKIKVIQTIILFLFSINLSSSQSIDLSLFPGTWDFPCSAPLDSPDELFCVDMIMDSSITYDPETREGKFENSMLGIIHTFEIFFENDKTKVKYHYEKKTDIGEIITLNEKKLKIIFEEAKYLLLFDRIK